MTDIPGDLDPIFCFHCGGPIKPWQKAKDTSNGLIHTSCVGEDGYTER